MRSPENPAYVIYTSGSTGTPKGVVVTHRSVVNYVRWLQSMLPLGPGSATALVSSPAFDLGYTALFGSLLTGGQLVLVPAELRRDPRRVIELIRKHRLTWLKATPSYLSMLLAEDEDAVDGVETILLGGEPQKFAELRGLRARLINHYGPTEATIGCIAGEIDDRLLAGGAPPQRIGRPVANARAYVLDRDLQPLPIGARGELYIGGASLARGYLNCAALTAERFVADPFVAGARMYRTGDLARRLADGSLEFLGRADQQVKIRGFRIELGEIERALAPFVSQCAVVVHEEQLVAYVVDPNVDDLRRELAERLPSYMIPAAFVALDALPVTPNGKLDRRALPAPDLARERYRAPRSPEEEILCDIFASVLGRDRVGIDDDFFSLGGHSLVATRLVSRVRAALGCELAIRTLFEAPTVAALAERLRSGTDVRMAVTRQPWPARLPLSYAQQRLWFLYRLDGPGPTYNIPAAFRIEGELDVDALRRAFADVVERHQTLRTRFPDEDGVPYQEILADAAPSIAIEDVSEEALSAKLAALAITAIDLATETPLRVWLLRLAPRTHVLVLLVHHIVSDGWSSGPLMVDLFTAYEARRRGEAPRFRELPVQYGDYALWQRALLGEESDADSLMARQLQWWRDALAGIPEDLDLPADRRRPARATYRGAAVPVDVDPALHARLLEVARATGTSLFMILQAGFAALLSRLGGGSDIPIGTAIAGRADRALEDLVGLFVNTLVLRTDVSGDPTFRELLARVRAFDLDAYGHQDVPFERVVEAVHPTPSLSRHPIFQVAMTLHNTPRVELDVAGLSLQLEPVTGDIAKFDLMLRMVEDLGPAGEPRGIGGNIEYSADRFDHDTAARLSERLLRLLAAAVAAPDVPLSRIEILAADERATLLETFNETARPVHGLFPALFEEQVARDPAAAALIVGGETISYGVLNRRANRLAHHLIGRGLAAGELVAVLMERSADMIVAFLGAWKAGLAYLPLDLNYPEARLQRMIDDAQPRCVLTTEALAARVKSEAVVVDAPDVARALNAEPAHDPRPLLLPQSAAYVIYTSGSTGTPKGVVVPHAGIANLAVAQARRLGIQPRSRVLQFASVGFDASVSEIVMTLGSGATLVLAREEERLGEPLSQLIARHRVTHATFPPILLPTLENAASLPLEAIIVAGESCPGALVDEWSSRLRMINAYGPTEVTVCATMSEPLSGAETPPIGTPLPGTRVYVLDAALEPMPAGAPGELYVAGPGVARGYHGRPALTAERFVADPYNPQPGARMYRTGDVARWNRDGTLTFLGRSDEQVKIRGQRVEPAEAEAALRSMPGVRDAAVVPIRRDDGVHLVAYFVPQTKLELWPSIAEFYVYDELVYSSMEQDEQRNAKYRAAFEQHLEDKVVVEIGPGPFAILSRLAAAAGARRVYAIELLEESYERAKRLVASLGLSGTITVLHGDARDVTLPEPADWCISEIVGAIGGSEGAAAIMNAARRLLRDPSHVLPARSVTRIAACALPEGSFHWGFSETAASYVERIFAEAGREFDLRLCVKGVGRQHLLTDDGVFEDLDYTATMPLEETHDVGLTVTRGGTATGFLIWLTLDLGDGEPLDILDNQASWLPVYVPFANGIALREGDRIAARVERTLCANGLNPDFRISGMAGDVPFAVDVPHAAESFRANPFHARLFAGGTIPRVAMPSATSLRQRLTEVLPSYAVPSWFIELPKLPMTTSGKLDKRALPAPQRTHAARAPQTQREKALCGIFAEVLSLPAVAVDDSFFELGGNSLLAVQLLSRARAALGLDLSVRDIFEAPTVAGLLERDGVHVDDDVHVLERDAVLPPDIDPAAAAPPARPRSAPANVLLTGATGFLGAFLLRELLDRTGADVHCLVRASSAADAMLRIRENLARYGLSTADVERRVRPLPGNLDEPLLGLGAADFDALARDLDAIYHNGGAVSFVAPYENLKPHNVNGTIEILRLASSHVRKSVHFVSTLGVWSNPLYLGQVIREDERPAGDGLLGGYNQSKWVAEGLLLAARDRGLPVKIYRPARIGGHSVSGVCNTADFFFSQIKGCIEIGCVPADEVPVNLAPVDYVSRGIVHLSLRDDGPAVHHFYNAKTVSSSTIADLIEDSGYPLRRISADAWLEELKQDSDNALVPFLPLFEREVPEAAAERPATVEFDCRTTESILEQAGIVCPPAAQLMRRYLDYLIESGFVSGRSTTSPASTQ